MNGSFDNLSLQQDANGEELIPPASLVMIFLEFSKPISNKGTSRLLHLKEIPLKPVLAERSGVHKFLMLFEKQQRAIVNRALLNNR